MPKSELNGFDLQLSQKEAVVLGLIIEKGNRPRYGLDLVGNSDGALKPGTVYVTLGRMERNRVLESREETAPNVSNGPKRRVYWATARGLAAWDAHKAWRYQLTGKMAEV